MRIKSIIRKLTIKLVMSIKVNRKIGEEQNYSKVMEHFFEFSKVHSNIDYNYRFISYENKCEHAFVGCVNRNDDVYLIPTDSNHILKLQNDNTLKEININDEQTFKFTGGKVHNNLIYAFPRKSKSLLIIDEDKIELKKVQTYSNCKDEHHYGGVITKNGFLYQPPRNTNYICCINLKTFDQSKIYITPKWMNLNVRYCASIIHPNGFIYMIPEYGKVVVLNPKNNKWKFIGKTLRINVYDLKVMQDGNIYGFTGYGNGMLKIDVKKNNVGTIFKDVHFGSYNSKLGINGCLYSTPGMSNKIWKFNCETNKLECVYEIEKYTLPLYAGGCVAKNGEIICSPISAKSIIKYALDENVEIPQDVYEVFFEDCY